MSRWPAYPCACAFAKTVGDDDPTHYPRVGIADNVIYRGRWIVRHSVSGQEAIIGRPSAPPLHAEADACCFDYFKTV